MAISIDYSTLVISVPQADLTLISGSLYEMDTDQFRLDLKALEANETGIVFDDTHTHNTEVTIGNLTLARVIEIINGYTITFEDLQYAVRLTGSNNNIDESTNINQVSIRSQNSAGLIRVGNSGVEKGVALPQFHFSMFDSTAPQTPIAGRTVTGSIAKDAETSFTALTNSIVEMASGSYQISGGLTATETDADGFTLLFTATGAETRVIHVITVPAT